jgi:endonuclease YncB( thermonuclease family)
MGARSSHLPLHILLAALLPADATAAQVVAGWAKVIDGDTVVVSGVHVRLKGIDAPERADPGGSEATVALRAIVGGWLTCALTGELTHGREVGYCTNAVGPDIGDGLALSCPRFDVEQRYFKFELPAAVQRQVRAVYCRGAKSRLRECLRGGKTGNR